MNVSEDKFIKRAILNYGIPLSDDIVWFSDNGIIFYGHNSGNDINYMSGYISRTVFVITHISDGTLDKWVQFVINYLELNYLDIRN